MLAADTNGALTDGVNCTNFTGTVGANGELAFSFTGPSEGNLDDFQLTLTPATTHDAPEPGPLAMAATALGQLGWMSSRRRRAAHAT